MKQRTLEKNTILAGKYIIIDVLGEGGFGVTYLCQDLNINIKVAIKEYFPSECSTRQERSVTALTGNREKQFQRGMEKFVEEAEKLAKFNKLEGIVSVKEFFYENNTAYMVMEYIDGMTMKEYLKEKGGRISWKEAITLMQPIISSLEQVHQAGIIHRDISPDNIMLTKEGNLKLIDFGAARMVDLSNEKSLTIILKHGYAPEEQYHTDGKQGPWTDVYSICATMYRMISGQIPQEATERLMTGDKVQSLSQLDKTIPNKLSKIIEKGLSVKSEKRYQSLEKLYQALYENGNVNQMKLGIIGITAAIAMVLGVGLGISLINKDEKNDGIDDKLVILEQETEQESVEENSVVQIEIEKEVLMSTEVETENVLTREQLEEYLEIYKAGIEGEIKDYIIEDINDDDKLEMVVVNYTDWSLEEVIWLKVEDGTIIEEVLLNSEGLEEPRYELEILQFGSKKLLAVTWFELYYVADFQRIFDFRNEQFVSLEDTKNDSACLKKMNEQNGFIKKESVPVITETGHKNAYAYITEAAYYVTYRDDTFMEYGGTIVSDNVFDSFSNYNEVIEDAQSNILAFRDIGDGGSAYPICPISIEKYNTLFSGDGHYYVNFLVTNSEDGQQIYTDDGTEKIRKIFAYATLKDEEDMLVLESVQWGKRENNSFSDMEVFYEDSNYAIVGEKCYDAYNPELQYAYEDIANSELVDMDEFYELERMINAYNSAWITLVNVGASDVYMYLREGNSAYDTAIKYDNNGSIERMAFCDVISVRKNGEYYYLWDHEKVSVASNGTEGVKEYHWIYRIAKDEDGFYVVDYIRDPAY